MTAPRVEIFTDGACSGNPGPGGWAAILRAGAHEKEIFGGERLTTNNRMELMAAIKALEALKKPSTAVIHTDSRYVMDGLTQWLPRWCGRKTRANSHAGCASTAPSTAPTATDCDRGAHRDLHRRRLQRESRSGRLGRDP